MLHCNGIVDSFVAVKGRRMPGWMDSIQKPINLVLTVFARYSSIILQKPTKTEWLTKILISIKMIHFKHEIRFHLKHLFTHFVVFLHQWFYWYLLRWNIDINVKWSSKMRCKWSFLIDFQRMTLFWLKIRKMSLILLQFWLICFFFVSKVCFLFSVLFFNFINQTNWYFT